MTGTIAGISQLCMDERTLQYLSSQKKKKKNNLERDSSNIHGILLKEDKIVQAFEYVIY